ncbi:polyprenyl synthetase family protein [SAR202 cluster bacterium AC-647-N09_OGT_505m]|nr:polyprenyl synthetase family protein [SAR202 cluster bacterium AC-647-N09_OGT_505m]
MNTLSLYGQIQDELEAVEEKLISIGKQSSFAKPSLLVELLGHVLKAPGKRTRPAITILASKLHPHDHELPIIMAGAVELLHIATLIHDDTVDNSPVRRGTATVSSRWGENVAVLLGDYVFATSATMVCDTNNVRVIRRFSETIMELSSGELSEISSAFNWDISRQSYWQRVYDKTASLFSTASESGAVLSGAPESLVQSLKSYGYNLGMAFQVVDDILDFQGTEEEIGKPVGNDLLQGTITLPSILLMERYPDDNPIKRLFENIEADGNLKQAIEMIQNSDIIPQSYSVAADLCHKATQALEPIPDSSYKRSLVDLAAYVMERRY